MGQLSQGSGLSGNVVHVTAALFETLMSESSFGNVYSHMRLWHPHGRVVPEKCALSHGSGVLEPSCGKRVHSHTDSAWGGEGYHCGGGGGVGEPRTGIIYIYIYIYIELICPLPLLNMTVSFSLRSPNLHTQLSHRHSFGMSIHASLQDSLTHNCPIDVHSECPMHPGLRSLDRVLRGKLGMIESRYLEQNGEMEYGVSRDIANICI